MSTTHDDVDITKSPLARASAGLDLCVHCGFCLQACPTYLALEDENDSPRGRLVLMQGVLDGDIAADDEAMREHISRCLGCRGCETACPSGVPFGHLLEATRATLREQRPTPLMGRVILMLFAQPVLLSVTMFFARLLRGSGLASIWEKLPRGLGAPLAMLAATAPGPLAAIGRVTGASRPTTGGALNRVSNSQPDASPATPTALFEGCVMRQLYGHVHTASRNVLRHNDYEIVSAKGQGCCGALHAHTGDLEKARDLARANIAAFEKSSATHIAVNAAGCGSMLKEYPLLLEDDSEWLPRARKFAAKVSDIAELLEARGPKQGAPMEISVAYDAPCHLQHAQRVVSAPLAVLAAIPGLRLYQSPDNDKCCGAAGIYNLLEPETSEQVLKPKLTELMNSGAEIVVTGNPGCMMQLGAGLMKSGSTITAAHPVELLDYSYRQEPKPSS